jgi:hypothetical protein
MKVQATRFFGSIIPCLVLAACSGGQAGSNFSPVATSTETPLSSAASPLQSGLVIENNWSSPIQVEEQSVGCFAYTYDGQTSLSIASQSEVVFVRNPSCDDGVAFRADGSGSCTLHISFLDGNPAAFNIAEDGAQCNWEWPAGQDPTFIYDN